MSRRYVCDQCDFVQSEPMVYRLTQMIDDEDEPDEYMVVTYHFCSTPCLDMFVMAIPRDIEDADTTAGDS